MGKNKVNIADDSDNLDDLLRDFQSRNEHRSDPNYVVEPVDLSTPLSDRFIKILRESSLETSVDEEVVEEPAPEPELNTGLVLLAEQYEKQSQQKLLLSRIFRWLAGIILLVAVVSFAAVAGYVWSGIAVAVVAVVFLIVSRMASSQAREIENIAAALVPTEESL